VTDDLVVELPGVLALFAFYKSCLIVVEVLDLEEGVPILGRELFLVPFPSGLTFLTILGSLPNFSS